MKGLEKTNIGVKIFYAQFISMTLLSLIGKHQAYCMTKP